jgi:3-hydroxyisobutyrate dehydrogenase
MTTLETIGFVGIGAMGTPMAANIAGAGYPVLVFDLDDGRSAALAAECATVSVADSLADLGAAVDIIITMLPDGKAVQTALCGGSSSIEHCLLERASRGTLVIDMSSSSPLDTRDLGELLAAHGMPFIDAPVSGGVKGAVAASLAIMVGGEKAIFERVQPLLAVMGGAVFHAGPLGAGHAIKALNNYVSAAGLVATCEALVAAQHFGVDKAVATDIINASTGMNNTTKNKVKQHILSGTFGAGFAASLMAKDIRTALEIIESSAIPADLARHSAEFWNAATDELPAGADHTAVYQLIAQAKSNTS